MLNVPLIKQDAAENLRLWFLVTGLMVLCVAAFTGGYVPAGGTKQLMSFSVLPQNLRTALGIEQFDGTLAGVLGGGLYGSVFRLLPMLFTVPAADRLLAGRVENGTMAYLLSAPGGRRRTVVTQIYYLAASLFLMFFSVFAAGCICGLVCKRGKLLVGMFFLMNFGAFCLHFCLAGISFLASCISNERRVSLMIGAGIPILLYLIWMLSNMGGIFDYLKYATVFSLFSISVILDGSVLFALTYPVLLLAGAACFWLGSHIFRKRDLPL